MSETTSDRPLIAAERVNGTAVYQREGEKIGKVEDLAIHKENGTIEYAILSFGGFLGMGEKYHAVPWDLLTYDAEKGGYVIPLDKSQLEKAPNFDADELSGWNDAASRDGIYGYYGPFGIAPYGI